MGFADRLKKLDKSIKKKKERKKKEEEKKLAQAQKKYDEMVAAMTPAERKAHEIAEKERLKDALALEPCTQQSVPVLHKFSYRVKGMVGHILNDLFLFDARYNRLTGTNRFPTY